MTLMDRAETEKTYRAIGRFVFEFSQVEYTIRVYLAEEIGLHGRHFFAVATSFDVASLCNITKQVFSKHAETERIKKGLNRFLEINAVRTRLAHGLWVPFMDGGTVHHVKRDTREQYSLTGQADESRRRAG